MRRIISLDDSKDLVEKGYLSIDPHVHSSFSYDVPESKRTIPEYVVAEQEKKGLLKIITDHDTMDAHVHLNREDVVKGVEIKIKPKKMRLVSNKEEMHTLHVNVYGLNVFQFKDLEGISVRGDLDEFVNYIRASGLNYQYNHPFWHEKREKMNWKAIPEIAKNYFDVIELNAGRPKMLNDLALYLAQQYGKGITSSTDTHTGRPGRARVLAKGKDFEDAWENIKRGEMYIVRSDMTALGVVEEAAFMIENIFDETIRSKKPYFSGTGIRVLDAMASKMHKTGHNDMLGKLFYKGLCFFNNSFGERLADFVYVKKENNFGKSIAGEIMGLVYDGKANSEAVLAVKN